MTPTTPEYLPTNNMANLLQGAPQGAAVILLDQDGTPRSDRGSLPGDERWNSLPGPGRVLLPGPYR